MSTDFNDAADETGALAHVGLRQRQKLILNKFTPANQSAASYRESTALAEKALVALREEHQAALDKRAEKILKGSFDASVVDGTLADIRSEIEVLETLCASIAARIPALEKTESEEIARLQHDAEKLRDQTHTLAAEISEEYPKLAAPLAELMNRYFDTARAHNEMLRRRGDLMGRYGVGQVQVDLGPTLAQLVRGTEAGTAAQRLLERNVVLPSLTGEVGTGALYDRRIAVHGALMPSRDEAFERF